MGKYYSFITHRNSEHSCAFCVTEERGLLFTKFVYVNNRQSAR